MFALSVRQPIKLNYWFIGTCVVYSALFYNVLRIVPIKESAHHITQQLNNTLSVHQVMFSAPQQQNTVMKPIIEDNSAKVPILPEVKQSEWALTQPKPKPRQQKPKPPTKAQEPQKSTPQKPPIEQVKAEPAMTENQSLQTANAPENLTESAVSAQAGTSQALSLDNIGQGDAQYSYMSALRQEIERRKRYPPQAKRMLLEGEVVIRFSLTEDGSVSTAMIANTSGISSIDNAGLAAVKRIRPVGPRPDNFSTPIIVTLQFNLK